MSLRNAEVVEGCHRRFAAGTGLKRPGPYGKKAPRPAIWPRCRYTGARTSTTAVCRPLTKGLAARRGAADGTAWRPGWRIHSGPGHRRPRRHRHRPGWWQTRTGTARSGPRAGGAAGRTGSPGPGHGRCCGPGAARGGSAGPRSRCRPGRGHHRPACSRPGSRSTRSRPVRGCAPAGLATPGPHPGARSRSW